MMFSIIIPASVSNNTFSYFKSCINSIVKQTLEYSFFEVVVVDNGSKKKIHFYLKKINKKLKNIKLITFKKKIGPGIARNYGIKKAKGEFLVFLDSDDMLPAYCLKNYYKIIKKKKFDAITSNWSYGDSKKPQRKDFKHLKKGKINFVKKYISMNFDGSVIFTVIKKDIFTYNKIKFPKGLHEDIFVIFKMFFFSKSIKILNKTMYFKRDNKYSIVNSFDEQRVSGYLNSWMMIKKFLIKKFGKKYFLNKLNNFFIKGIYGLIAIMILENQKINQHSIKKGKNVINIKNLIKKIFYNDLKNHKLRDETYYDKIAKVFIEKNILLNKSMNKRINLKSIS